MLAQSPAHRIPRLAVIDESERSVLVDGDTDFQGPVLAVTEGTDPTRSPGVEEAYVADSVSSAQTAIDPAEQWVAAKLEGKGTDSVLMRARPQQREPIEVFVRSTHPRYADYKTDTSDLNELSRVVDLDQVNLDLPAVDAAAILSTLIRAAGLKVKPPKGGFPSETVSINASAHPIAMIQGICNAFGMQFALKGDVWTFSKSGAAKAVPAAPDPLSPEDEELQRLSKLPEDRLSFKNMELGELLVALTMRADMRVIMPDSELPQDPVTIRGEMNPFEMLKIVTARYGLGLEYRNRVWNIYPIDIGEIIPRTYAIQHNDELRLEVTPPQLNLDMNNIASGNNSNGSNGNGSNASSYGANGNQSNQDVFELPDTHPIIERLQAVLDLPTTGLHANRSALKYITNHGGELPPPTVHSTLWGHRGRSIGTGDAATAPQQSSQSAVQYFPDSGQLVVYATRQQHEYIEEVVKAFDRPQRIIHYTAFIFETSVNPSSELGLDWSETAQQRIALTDYSGPTLSDGFNFGGAVLDEPTLAVQLNFLAANSETVLTNKPSVTSRAMESVRLASMEQRPVQMASYDTTATGGTVSTQIGYIRIGTGLDAFGRVLNGTINGREAIELQVVLTISERNGDVVIDGNPAPIVQERTYRFAAVVPDNHTLVIGGITKEYDKVTEKKLPLLGDIPVIKHAFSSKSKERQKVNLIAYITPTLVNDADGNIKREANQPTPVAAAPDFHLISSK